jgi:excisionase family DNA binding protein
MGVGDNRLASRSKDQRALAPPEWRALRSPSSDARQTVIMASRSASPPVLLTIAETAALLRTTPKAVYTMIERGRLDGVVRVGRRVLVNRERLMASLGGAS